MNGQFGFDFGNSEPVAVFQEQPAGTWTDPAFTTAQYLGIFERAEGLLHGIHESVRGLFARGIAAARMQHTSMVNYNDYAEDDDYHLWRCDGLEIDADELAGFRDLCTTTTAIPGATVKFRHERNYKTTAMHVEGVGTIIVREWSNVGTIAVDYYPWRDPFFLDSYRDNITAISAPVSVWGTAYCADKMATDEQANLPTFVLMGREYVNSGGMSSGDYRECHAWTFRPLADWRGPTYSYQEQCRAWDDGRIERGDLRGRRVRVRGQQCILDGAALVFDECATEPLYLLGEDEEDETETGDELVDELEEEEGDELEVDYV